MKKIMMLLSLVACMACNSDKAKIETYLENNYSDREIEVVGDIAVDSAFCPLSKIDEAAIEIMGYKAQLQELLVLNPDSAYVVAANLQNKFADNKVFVNMAYPKGNKNRLAYMVKCNQGGKERVITFFKSESDDFVESSSLDVDDAVDSLLVSYNMLMDGVRIINQDKSNSNSKPEAKEKAKDEEKAGEEEKITEEKKDDEKSGESEKDNDAGEQ